MATSARHAGRFERHQACRAVAGSENKFGRPKPVFINQPSSVFSPPFREDAGLCYRPRSGTLPRHENSNTIANPCPAPGIADRRAKRPARQACEDRLSRRVQRPQGQAGIADDRIPLAVQTDHPIHDAILLIGPTGSGKSPLGEFAGKAGFHGRRCAHFDFGHQLRLAAAGDAPGNDLSAADTAFVRGVLATGTLLEKESFHIADTLLRHFIDSHAPAADDIIVLNGLPRHVGQAGPVATHLRIIRVVCLQCPPEEVFARIRHNSGGDRDGRRDDAPDDIRRKLRLFEARTAPLREYYRRQGIPVITRRISPQDDPATLWEWVTC